MLRIFDILRYNYTYEYAIQLFMKRFKKEEDPCLAPLPREIHAVTLAS